MKDATARNEVQVIQNVLEEFLENRKAAKVAVDISATMQEETKHTHMGEVFYIHKDEVGALVLTMESTVNNRMEKILSSYLEEDEVQECMEEMLKARKLDETKNNAATTEFETIKVEGSESNVYVPLMEHKAAYRREKVFMKALKEAISASVQNFEVFACDPSIDENGKLQFVSGFKPAYGYCYYKLEDLAKDNGLRLGNKYEYVLFLGTLINNLIANGWSEADAWYSVCCDSKELGHYKNSSDAKPNFELTGSRKIVGKYDLVNTRKILAKDEKAGGFWLAGGDYNIGSNLSPLADLNLLSNVALGFDNGVGWFVR